MSRRSQENALAVVLLLVFIGFAWISAGYSYRSRLVPLPVAIASILLISLQMLIQNLRPDRELNVDAAEILASEGSRLTSGMADAVDAGGGGGSEVVGILLVAAFLGLILLVGILVGIFLYVFGYFYLAGKEKLWVALAYALGTEISVYLLFVVLLRVDMYEGWLMSLLGA